MAEKKYSGKSNSDSKSSNRKSKRSFSKNTDSSQSEERGSYKKKDSGSDKSFSKFRKDKGALFSKSDKPKRSYDKSYFDKDSRDKKPFDKESSRDKKPFKKEDGDKPKRTYDKSYFDKNTRDKKPFNKDSNDKKPFNKKDGDRSSYADKRKSYGEDKGEKRFKSYDKDKKSFGDKPYKKRESDQSKPKKHSDDGLIRLNKYLANAGISSRRDADTLILGGTVKVNGVVVDTLGYKVKATDVVTYADSAIKNEKKVYLLLNKPKDFITTTDDPQERRTVMELVRPACKERIYPVGRLDRNTTGLLLFTNDGDIATKLMHPKHEIKKVYHVTINKPMRGEDYKAVGDGITLDDGPVKVDHIAFVGEGKKEIGLEIHSGKNRIVRRIFEHLGYEVLKLDRVSFAGLTKKDLPRGKYRFLTDKEIAFLKMLG